MSKIIGITNISKFIGVSRFKFFNNLFGSEVLDTYTKLLLHGDGTNGSTTFTDSSLSPKTMTPHGNVRISTVQSKFGGSSIYFDGNGDYLESPYSSDFNFSGNNYTLDGWVKPELTQGEIGTVAGCQDAAQPFYGWAFKIRYGALSIEHGASDIYNSSDANLLNGDWHHIAVTLQGSTLRMSADGNIITTFTNIVLPVGTSKTLRIGFRNDDWYYYKGYLDEFRISKGIARWTSNFTPPAYPYGG